MRALDEVKGCTPVRVREYVIEIAVLQAVPEISWKYAMWNQCATNRRKKRRKANETIYLARSRWIDSRQCRFCPGTAQKVEITGYYSYFRFNPENSGTLSSHSLNGGGADISYFFTQMIGIKAEFGGYQSNSVTFTNGTSTATASANLFYLQWRARSLSFRFREIRTLRRGTVSAALIPAFTATYANSWRLAVVNNPSNNAFDFVIGGRLSTSR